MSVFSDEESSSVFSDADLKRLKATIQARHRFALRDFPISFWDSLLARLEAAEKITVFGISEHSGCEDKTCPVFAHIEEWRKSAGNGA